METDSIVLLERDEWAKKAADDLMVREGMRKGIATKARSLDKDDRSFEIVISSENPDRDKDVIEMAGWDLKNFKTNPVVQWAHSHAQPAIATSKRTVKDGEFLIGTPKFPEEGVYPFADMIFNLYAADILRAASVGMLPKKYAWNEDRRGYDFMKHELLEFSLCNVPANPEALRRAKGLGIDIAPLKEWAIKVLDEDTPGIWIPMTKIQHALKIADGDKVQITVVEDVDTEKLEGLEDTPDTQLEGKICPECLRIAEELDKAETDKGLEDESKEKGEEADGEKETEKDGVEGKEEKKEGQLVEASGTSLLLALSESPKASILDEITTDLRDHVREAVKSGMTAFTGKLD